MAQMQDLLAKSFRDFREGSIVKGRVLEIRPREVLVDIGYKSEGVIPSAEFDNIDTLEVGDEVDVLLERLENDEGMVVLSKEKAAYRQNWNKIASVFQGDGLIKGKVKSVVKGGLMVNIGVEAFLPASQIDIVPPKDLQQFVGNTYDFKIVKINDDRRNVVLSRREIIEQERSEKRQKFLESVNVGNRVTGTVKNLTDFGAFIDLDGMDGLLHITDMTWGRLGHPSEMVKVGQQLEVVVLDINKEKERVSLGLKQTQRNPWDQIEERFPAGQRVKGKITNLVPYGAFVELEEGVEGLIHVSELSWTKRIMRPSDILSVGQEVEAVVLVKAIVEFAVEIDLSLTIIGDIIEKKPCEPSKEISAIVHLFAVLDLDLHLLIEAEIDVAISLKGEIVVEALVELALAFGIDIHACLDDKPVVRVAAFVQIILAIEVKVEIFVAVGLELHLAKRALLDVAAMGSIDAVQTKRDAQFARALTKMGASDIAAHLARRKAALGVNLDVSIDIDVEVAIFVQAIIELFASIDVSLDVIAEIVKSGGHCGCGERPEIVALVALFLELDIDLKVLLDVSLAVGTIKGDVCVKALVVFALALDIDVNALVGVDLSVNAEAFVTLLVSINIDIDVFVKICAKIDLRRRAIELLA